jgi:hypothetical protein
MSSSTARKEQVMRTPSLSELCELVGLSVLSAIFARVGGVGLLRVAPCYLERQVQSTQRNGEILGVCRE